MKYYSVCKSYCYDATIIYTTHSKEEAEKVAEATDCEILELFTEEETVEMSKSEQMKMQFEISRLQLLVAEKDNIIRSLYTSKEVSNG